MIWKVLLHEEFEKELLKLPENVQDRLAAYSSLLKEFGPQLGRPHADTLKGSCHANMKELRFSVDTGIWRVAFAFDARRQAILLVAGNKASENQKQFYKDLLHQADKRFSEWKKRQKGE